MIVCSSSSFSDKVQGNERARRCFTDGLWREGDAIADVTKLSGCKFELCLRESTRGGLADQRAGPYEEVVSSTRGSSQAFRMMQSICITCITPSAVVCFMSSATAQTGPAESFVSSSEVGVLFHTGRPRPGQSLCALVVLTHAHLSDDPFVLQSGL